MWGLVSACEFQGPPWQQNHLGPGVVLPKGSWWQQSRELVHRTDVITRARQVLGRAQAMAPLDSSVSMPELLDVLKH